MRERRGIPTSPIVTANLILTTRTIAIAVAQSRSWYADITVVAFERLHWATKTGTLFVGTVGAIGAAVTNEEPADAASGRPALERARRAAGSPRTATAVRRKIAIAHTADAPRHRIGHTALQIGNAWQSQADGRHYRALVTVRLYWRWKTKKSEIKLRVSIKSSSRDFNPSILNALNTPSVAC